MGFGFPLLVWGSVSPLSRVPSFIPGLLRFPRGMPYEGLFHACTGGTPEPLYAGGPHPAVLDIIPVMLP